MSAISKALLGQMVRDEFGSEFGDPVAAMLTRQGKRDNAFGGIRGPVQTSSQMQQFAKQKARQMFGPGHYPELHELVTRESGWNPTAQNPTSTAYGLFQFLDSTRENYNLDKSAGPRKQIKKGLKYILDRYKNPTQALAFHDENNWY